MCFAAGFGRLRLLLCTKTPAAMSFASRLNRLASFTLERAPMLGPDAPGEKKWLFLFILALCLTVGLMAHFFSRRYGRASALAAAVVATVFLVLLSIDADGLTMLDGFVLAGLYLAGLLIALLVGLPFKYARREG